MKVFLVYDKIINGTPIINAETDYECKFHKRLMEHGIETKLVLTDRLSYTKFDGLYVYPIDVLYRPFSESAPLITDQTVIQLKKYRIPILILGYMEGYFGYEDLSLESKERLHGIDLYTIVSNLKTKQSTVFKNYLSNFKKVYVINYFESTTRLWGNSLSDNYKKTSLENFPVSQKHKDFLCMNRNLRPHRIALLSELLRQELLDNSYFSMIKNNDVEFNDITLRQAKSYIGKISQHYFDSLIKNFQPVNLPLETSESVSGFDTPVSCFKETFCSVITETEVDPNTLFVSEKIFKAINFFHPFIVFGSPDTLSWLRSQGFETFPELFDESYDQETDIKKRLHMIVKEIKKFKALTLSEKQKKISSVIPKLQHNYDLFWSRPNIFKSEIENIFEELYHWRSVGESNS